MNYEFPKIEHINDVLPFIKEKEEIKILDKGNYVSVDYMISTSNTFDSDISKECRGLLFDKNGHIIGRRYHKFFNLGEKVETQSNNLNFSNTHLILEKLDGSMVSPFEIDGYIRMATRAGITTVAMQSEVYIASRKNYNEFNRRLLEEGFNPIYEWCSTKNRVVINHPEDKLILTGIRDIVTGDYFSYSDMLNITNQHDIPMVNIANVDLESVRNITDAEGIVVRFDDGHMIKVKSDWYTNLHKMKENLLFEKNVVEMILSNKADDIKAQLPKEDLEKSEKYEKMLLFSLRKFSNLVEDDFKNIKERNLEKKQYAIETEPSLIRSMVLSNWDCKDIFKKVIEYAIKQTSSSNKLEEMKKNMYFDKCVKW